MPDTLTTATAIIPIDHWQAAIMINAPAGLAMRAAGLLGFQPFDIRQDGEHRCSFKVALGAAAITITPPEVAQAASEAVARAIGHIIPTLRTT